MGRFYLTLGVELSGPLCLMLPLKSPTIFKEIWLISLKSLFSAH